jgi:hypothetical protein
VPRVGAADAHQQAIFTREIRGDISLALTPVFASNNNIDETVSRSGVEAKAVSNDYRYVFRIMTGRVYDELCHARHLFDPRLVRMGTRGGQFPSSVALGSPIFAANIEVHCTRLEMDMDNAGRAKARAKILNLRGAAYRVYDHNRVLIDTRGCDEFRETIRYPLTTYSV